MYLNLDWSVFLSAFYLIHVLIEDLTIDLHSLYISEPVVYKQKNSLYNLQECMASYVFVFGFAFLQAIGKTNTASIQQLISLKKLCMLVPIGSSLFQLQKLLTLNNEYKL